MRTPSLYVGGKVQGFSVAVIGLHCCMGNLNYRNGYMK